MVVELCLGALVGLVLGLTGAGGGILAVPLLVFGLGLSLAQAAPVSLIAVGIASALGAFLGLREGIVRYRSAAVIGAVGVAFVPLGQRLAQAMPNAPLMMGFSVLLFGVALRMFKSSETDRMQATHDLARSPCITGADRRLLWTRRCAWALARTGAASGLCSGLLGVGGGFVIVPALTRFTDLSMRSITATSMAVIALVAIGGAGAAALQGVLVVTVALPFAIGTTVALLVGRHWAVRLSGPRLRQFFACTAGVVALMLFARAFREMSYP